MIMMISGMGSFSSGKVSRTWSW